MKTLKINFKFFILVFLLLTKNADAQDFKVFVDKTKISISDAIVLTVLSNQELHVDLSNISDFKIISSGNSTNVQIINGKYSKEIKQNYTLFPKKVGKLEIPPLKIIYNKQKFFSNPISIEVTENQISKDDKNSLDIFVKARVSKNEAYLGEHIIYYFDFFADPQITFTNPVLEKPKFDKVNFISKDIGKKTYSKIINGKNYNVTTLTFFLTPLKKGKFQIKPSSLSLDIITNKKVSDPFNNMFNSPFVINSRQQIRRQYFQTNPLDVQIRELPTFSNKQDISSLIGNILIKSSIDKNKIELGGSANLSIQISGSANFSDIEELPVKFPSAFKYYKDKAQDNIKLGENGYTGTKTFKYALVPTKAGSFKIGPFCLKYFDVNKKAYKEICSQSFDLLVQKAEKDENVHLSNKKAVDKEDVRFISKDILPIKTDLSVLEKNTFLSFKSFITLYLLPFLILLIFCLIQKIYLKQTQSNKNILNKKKKQALKDAQNNLEDKDKFLNALSCFIVASVCLQKDEDELSFDELKEYLEDDKSKEIFENLYNKINQQRYGKASADMGKNKRLLNETIMMLKDIK